MSRRHRATAPVDEHAPESSRKFLTIDDLVAETGYSRATMYRICAPVGDLPCVRKEHRPSAKRKTRSMILVARVEWEAWLVRHTSGAQPQETPERAVVRTNILHLAGADRYLS